MTYNAGTATDYLDMLDQLVEVVTSRHMDTVAVNAGGTGHAVGDIIDIDATGSTSTHVAQIEVVTVSTGVITAARIYRGGAYTVDPTTTTGNAQSATTGSGINATFDLTFAATGWTVLTQDAEAASAVVSAGGTGYSVSDVLTLVGGVLTNGGSAATFSVATLSGSAVATVTLVSAGSYEVFPSNPVLTTVSPSGGTGCTLTVTSALITGSNDRNIVLQGDAGSSLDPLVGIKTYSSETDETGANTVHNWAIFGMSAWSALAALHEQSNVSPGFDMSAADGSLTLSATGDGAFVPLKESTAFNINWWISATGRRVHLIARVEAAATVHYAHASFGLLNQFGISTELPYPAYVLGSSDRKRVWYRDTSAIFGGMSEVISRNTGPGFVFTPEGTWLEMKNASISTNQATTPSYATSNNSPRIQVWPIGEALAQTGDDEIWAVAGGTGFDNDDLTLTSGAIEIYRTPDTGGDLFPLFPVTVTQADSSSGFYRTFGELDGVWWLHSADASLSSEDRFKQGSVAFGVFQNGTRIQPWSYLALQED